MNIFDKSKIKTEPLFHRKNKLYIEKIIINPFNYPVAENKDVAKIGLEIINAKAKKKPVIVAFGAHLIKNGLSFVLGELVKKGYITHLATNGAGSIHDWEFAYQGKTGEDVRERVSRGLFGMNDETGKFINLSIRNGALNNLGYGESVGKMIYDGKVVLENGDVKNLDHAYKNYSLQNIAFENNILFTVHPGIGYDIIYTHPLCSGEAIGKTAYIDFLKFADSVSKLEGGGVYLSIGSAIMSPMIFEKSLSMSRNVSLQKGKKINDFMIVVNDISDEKAWEFGTGKEPDESNPAYYSRLCKSFDRMGAKQMKYIKMDNRDFLVGLYKVLIGNEEQDIKSFKGC